MAVLGSASASKASQVSALRHAGDDREEFGLDLDLKGNEIAIDERIFNLIGDWYNPHTPAGEVARATDERWGVPLRAVDAAELEYRERYIAQAATSIPQWAEAHASSSSVTARAYATPIEGHETDAEAIKLWSGFSPPSWIFANSGSQLRPGTPALPVVGEPVCHSGIEGGHACGIVDRLTEQWIGSFPAWLWETNIFSCEGDSGGPYWQPDGNTPLGIEDGGPSHELPDKRVCGKPSYFTPLVESRAEEMGVEVGRNVGVLQAPGLSNMKFHGAVN